MSGRHELHPSVQQFKHFMKEHPLLLKEVKEERKTLQGLYEEWSVLGGDNEQWLPYKRVQTNGATDDEATQNHSSEERANEETTQNTSDTLSQIMGLVKRMNVQDLQNHVAQFSSVLANVQNVIQSFQKPNNPPNQSPQDHPFSFRRD
ncbi:YlbD family protein [Halalkalibacter alkalisediminis]|uniref:YlbD family protein n=1 Tax=Halalkalibacter alkalisediminis TaxID=935616 RepID=A0ABV6ND89_9BACI|nr:YlbD family protein [Halalkalibacter alkalisediminis]